MYEIARNLFKLSTMVGENFEIYMSEMANNTLKLSTMVGENFNSYIAATNEQINKDMESHRYGERFIVPALLRNVFFIISKKN